MINTIIGKYKITKLIGEGGMASVYEAEHEMLGTKVAIKVLNPILSANSQIRERFRNEAKLMASLDHPNITKVIDFDEQPQQLSIVMEYLNGEDLNKKIKSKGALSEKEIVAIFSQSLSAFQYAHEKGIAHRDIKPSNIFVLPDGTVKILDFGIAKLFGQSNEMTQTGTQMGTPIYMSPEQVKADKTIDHRSDIYSLGVTLYYALNGKPPYDSNTTSQFDIFSKIVYEQLTLGDIHSRFDAIIRKACAKDRDERYQSCDAFLSEINSESNSKNIDSKKIEGEKTIIDSSIRKEPALERTIIENKASEIKEDEKKESISKENPNSLPKKRKWFIAKIAAAILFLLGFVIFYAIENKDSDNDGVIDKYDHCIYEYGEMGGCPDSDNDGTPDYRDDCPDAYSENNRGCPDMDNDGVVDSEDLCPETPGNDPNGCFYHKQVNFTNNSSIQTFVCIGYFHEGNWICEGWTIIDANQNINIDLPEHFDQSEIYWYVTDQHIDSEWSSNERYFNVEYGVSDFKTVNGEIEYGRGDSRSRKGFYKLALEGEITYQSFQD